MPKIRVLPVDLCNKIAAGEVIERPASVVKELIENSLDAGSTEIAVAVSHGGKRLIRVADNGDGMDRDDALLCFSSHATSKIKDYDDLFNIHTLGFRGEALPSIASVSKTKLVTAPRGMSAGISLELVAGGSREIKDAAAAGTTIEIRDLFFNIPARKKFLKTDSTELFHIIDTVTKEAISHPETAFSLHVDQAETIRLPRSSGFRERLMQIYGEEFLSGLIETSSAMDGLEMQAFVSNGTAFRNTKSHQFLFLNRRPIKDQSVAHAVYKAYEGIVPPDKHPIYFLFLGIDPHRVDFNVHPAKKEVRFADKEIVYRFVLSGLRDVVKQARKEYVQEFGSIPDTGRVPCVPSAQQSSYSAQVPAPDVQAVSEDLGLDYRPSLPHIYLGDTFVALAGRGGLTIIDHHAAHERILFEKLLNGMETRTLQMLFPKQVRLSAKEHSILLGNRDTVRTFGIEIEDFGENTVIVRTLPAEIEDADVAGILSDIAAGLQERQTSERPLRYDLAARIACHSSVRGRKILSQEELSGLIDDLDRTEHPDQCPHGRPTRIFFSLNDLNKLFKRK